MQKSCYNFLAHKDNTKFALVFSRISFLLLCVLSASLLAAESQLLPPEMHKLRTQGFDHLFNMKYEEAKKSFGQMITVDPEHPAGHIYAGNAVWLNHLADLRRLQSNVYNRNNSFFATEKEEKADPKIDTEFRKHMNKGVELAETRIKQNKNDLKAIYFLGVAKNILAGYEATVNRSFFPALRNGTKGVNLHRELIKKDPTLIDAYLSVGMYDYIVGSLPLAVKILVFFGGVQGSKRDGLAMLERVFREGTYGRDEAAVILVMLYNREKRLQDALKVLDDLCTRYPENSLFPLERAVTLANLGRYSQSYDNFGVILKNERAMEYMPDVIHYQYAEALFAGADWDTALNQYVKAGGSTKAPESLKTMALLNEGRCFDAMGQREKALERYSQVLRRKEAFDSHDQAKQLEKKPFKP